MTLDTARRAGRSLARLVSTIAGRSEESGEADVERIVTIPEPDVGLEVLRELQALDAEWDEERHTPRDTRWID